MPFCTYPLPRSSAIPQSRNFCPWSLFLKHACSRSRSLLECCMTYAMYHVRAWLIARESLLCFNSTIYSMQCIMLCSEHDMHRYRIAGNSQVWTAGLLVILEWNAVHREYRNTPAPQHLHVQCIWNIHTWYSPLKSRSTLYYDLENSESSLASISSCQECVCCATASISLHLSTDVVTKKHTSLTWGKDLSYTTSGLYFLMQNVRRMSVCPCSGHSILDI